MTNTTKVNLNKVIDELLFDFAPKQRKVIEGRFGLKGKRFTLQEIGDELGVTRERIRQIESQGLQRVRPRIKKELDWLIKHANAFLEDVGGVRRDDYFMREVRHIGNIDKVEHIDSKLRFVFLISGSPQFHGEDARVEDFWYVNDGAKQRMTAFLNKVVSFFDKQDKTALFEDKVYLDKLSDIVTHHYVAISKQFDTNVFGDFGLKKWPEIQPKVVRDKAYLVLKKQRRPLHFRDIARLITELGIDTKPTHMQTVHNELIKDARFVLVGRGTYGLQEHGFEGGTVREVIERILKESGALSSDEVLRLVGERKILKENTILLNLQNRKHFKRLEDGRYAVRKT